MPKLGDILLDYVFISELVAYARLGSYFACLCVRLKAYPEIGSLVSPEG